MNREQCRTNPRLASMIDRYHTWPTLQRQSVGDHVFNQMRIYWQLFGPLPPEVSTYIIWSDAGELKTGDLPFPVKSEVKELKDITQRLEHDAVVEMGGPREDPNVTPEQLRQIKICDLMEMFEWGLIEVVLGNRFGEPIVVDTRKDIFKLAPDGELNTKVGKFMRSVEDKYR